MTPKEKELSNRIDKLETELENVKYFTKRLEAYIDTTTRLVNRLAADILEAEMTKEKPSGKLTTLKLVK